MSIRVVCPEGHDLKIKDKYAGRTGRCPLCKSRIKIPVPDEEIPGGLVRGIYDPGKSGLSGLALEVPEFIDDPADEESEDTMKVCGKCQKEIPAEAQTCPYCKAYIATLDDQ